MDFLLGFGCLLIQMQVTTLIVLICKKYPDAILGMAGAMVSVSYTHLRAPRDMRRSRMPSSA